MRGIAGKIVLVTGGASGLGRAIGERLHAEGGTVVISDIDAQLGQTTAAGCGFSFLQHDVCSEERWAEVMTEVGSRFGGLDILVNNAGIVGVVEAADPENARLIDWRAIFSANVESVLLGCQAAIRMMRRRGGGSIINISSVAGLLATPAFAAYGASKAAVRHLTKSVAQHCAQERQNIRCNSVHPGNIRTRQWESSMREVAIRRGISFDEILAEAKCKIPLGEFAVPEDVAAAVAFLASDESRHITGAQLVVDGGVVDCDTYRPRQGSVSATTR